MRKVLGLSLIALGTVAFAIVRFITPFESFYFAIPLAVFLAGAFVLFSTDG